MNLYFSLTELLRLNVQRQAKRPSTKVQTLILSKKVFKSVQLASKWVRDHGFKVHKIDETEASYRFRQLDPNLFIEGSFRTISLTNGVKAVIGRPKKSIKREKISYKVDFISREDEQQIVTGVVADASNVDSYSNRIPREEIWKAAYRFMELYQNMGVSHNRDDQGNPIALNDKIKILESWVTRDQTMIGDLQVPADAWLLTVRVDDPIIWKSVKDGNLTGFSFEAKTKRVPIGDVNYE